MRPVECCQRFAFSGQSLDAQPAVPNYYAKRVCIGSKQKPRDIAGCVETEVGSGNPEPYFCFRRLRP